MAAFPTRCIASTAILLLAGAGRGHAQRPAERADLIVTADRIYTVDQSRPLVEAIAIRGDRIVYAGPRLGADALAGASTRTLHFPGRTILPGLADAHGHLTDLGFSLQDVDLTGARSYDEVIARVVARAKTAPAGAWIEGNGWDQNRWGNTAFPTEGPLTKAVPDHPVVLERVDGHALLVNARGLAAAGVTKATKDPSGGRIVRMPDGSPSGVFVDNAQDIVRRVVPRPTRDQIKQAIIAGAADANRWGLVSVHDPGEPQEVLDVLEDLARSPLGSRGAALLDPYSDDPGNDGLLVSAPEHIKAVAIAALEHGFQVCTHAIGDRANRLVLDAYQAALAQVPAADHRFRIEHAQILNFADIPRFAELGVIPSMQATHQTSDMYWAEQRLGGGRLYGAYAWRSLLQTGVIIPDGTDFPVEAVNPMRTFHSAISRQDEHDWPPGGWHPEQKMSRDEALRSMTIWPAYAAFEDSVMGSLTPGKYADFVVLDQDIMRAPPETILATHVVATYIGGKPVYERGADRTAP